MPKDLARGQYFESATQRMERARASTKVAIGRELALVAILSRIWRDSHQCRVPSGEHAICLHTPAGPEVWRILDDSELALFAHLPTQALDCEDWRGTTKLATLLDLAINGWG